MLIGILQCDSRTVYIKNACKLQNAAALKESKQKRPGRATEPQAEAAANPRHQKEDKK